MEKFKIASFFAGVGGIDLGFEQTGFLETIYANEIDIYPVKTFEKNFNIKVDCRDIKNVNPSEVPKNADGYCLGFPCQPFSIAGYRQGLKDLKGRGNLFFEVMRIVHENKPRFIFIENVKNLVNHDDGKTFKIILDSLLEENYKFHQKILNAMDYGNIPQNRERIYIVAFQNNEDFKKFYFPEKIPLTKKLQKLLILKILLKKNIITRQENIKAIFMKNFWNRWTIKIQFINGEENMFVKI